MDITAFCVEINWRGQQRGNRKQQQYEDRDFGEGQKEY